MTHHDRAQWLGVSLGADGRSALRSAIKSHDGWGAYRADRGLSLDGMTTVDLIDAALALGIDIAAVTGRSPAGDATRDAADHHKPRPYNWQDVDALRARFVAASDAGRLTERNRAFISAVLNTIDAKQNGEATERHYGSIDRILMRAKHKAAENAAETHESAAATPATEKPAMNAYSPAAPVAGDAAHQLAGLITQLAGQAMNPAAVRELVQSEIEAALKSIPSVRIECKGPDGETREIGGHQHPQFKQLLIAATSQDANDRHPNIWLAGPAGSGKTHAVEQVAHAMGLSFHFNGAISNAFELLGFIDAGGTYHRTAFRNAFEAGGVYLFDEVDGSDNSAILALNAALANGACQFPDGMIKRHRDCVIMASANTHGLGATAEYVGRARIDGAFLDRFGVRFNWTYDNALELAISGNEAFARRVIAARERARAAGLKVLITPRASQAGAALIAAGMTSDEAAELTYLANLSADQRKIVEGR